MTFEVTFVSSLNDIPAANWDALWPSNYPFTQHRFLVALESSQCTQANTGWQPHHLLIKKDNALIAGLPLYIKSHSYGEYVFDWSWAQAYEEHGLEYYPKIISAIPFTPATGPRWGVKSESINDAEQISKHILTALTERVNNTNLSGVHCLFPDATLREYLLQQPNWMERLDYQYHWFNKNYSSFDDYLEQFTSRKRKNIKKERQKVTHHELEIRATVGVDLSESDWKDFYLLYRQTYIKRSGHLGYLNEAFFLALGKTMADQVMLVRAYKGDHVCAAALYFFDQSTLYGRYWGCIEEYDGLHFECCYYQGIEFAIQNKIARFDPGAQGQHKIGRGFQPVLTCSFHYIKHPQFSNAIADFLRREKPQVLMHGDALREQLPFKEGYAMVDEDVLLKEFDQE